MTLFASLLVLLICAGVLFGIIRIFGTKAVLLRKAHELAVTAAPFMKELEEAAERARDAAFEEVQLSSLASILFYQVCYIHDTLGLLAAEHVGNPNPALNYIRGFAFPERTSFMNYGNSLIDGLNKHLANKDLTTAQIKDIENMKCLLRRIMQAVGPLQEQLKHEFRKSGITYGP